MHDSIFAKPNKYGYEININNETMRRYYDEYKQRIGVPKNVTLTDTQRFEFESFIFANVLRKNIPPV